MTSPDSPPTTGSTRPVSGRAIETEVLVVGSGPAGASAALFLASHGIDVLVITRFDRLATTPRSHLTNSRTMEVFRDAGIEDRVLRQADSPSVLENIAWTTSLAGTELGRMRVFGTGPERRGEYEAASPSDASNVSQDRLEPVVLGAATERGAVVRFGHELVDLTQDADGVTAVVRDRSVGDLMEVRCRYLVGADGARSRTAELVGLPFDGRSDLATAVNIMFRADLSRYTAHRPGTLYWVFQPRQGDWGGTATMRLVRPWNEWMAIVVQRPGEGEPDTRGEAWLPVVRAAIGDDDVPVEIQGVRTWSIHHVVASEYRAGRVLCVGDAVHRHPPTNGLGSNTSVQDSFNLAWKLALVLRSRAGEGLLDTYSAERQPVGRQVVDRANLSLVEHRPLIEALGVASGQDPAAFAAAVAVRSQPGEDGERARKAFAAAVETKNYEFNALGVELNQQYTSSAILPDHHEPNRPRSHVRPEAGANGGTPQAPTTPDVDTELHYVPTTRPGARIPHAWLATPQGTDQRQLSTLDLVGGNQFAILTGPGGDTWIHAAQTASQALNIPITTVRIGPGQDYTDLYGTWEHLREIHADGCLIVRPDHHIAWRTPTAHGLTPPHAAQLLTDALAAVLHVTPPTLPAGQQPSGQVTDEHASS